jgi:ligand-binding sensor domain-containing protein
LIKLDASESAAKTYSTLDGLPDNDLTALAVFRERLFVGTSNSGLLSFDGTSFTGYRFIKPKASRVSALVSTESELLVGTIDGGLFEFDGERFSRRFNSTPGAEFARVTAVLPYESRLYVGTQDQGLYIWREARIEHLSAGEGLPSPHVTGLAELPDAYSSRGAVAVATDFGVVGLDEENGVKPISGRANVTSIATSGRRLWAGLFGGGIVDLGVDLSSTFISDKQGEGSAATGLPRDAATMVSVSDDRLWALTTEGAFSRAEDRESGPGFEAVSGSMRAEGLLSARHVTGLAIDGRGRLWVGYFDRGLDSISTDTSEKISHLEDERLREVNFLTYDRNQDRVIAATSMGLALLDARMNQTMLTREQNGLVNNSIAHVALIDDSLPGSGDAADRSGLKGMLLATAGGLTELNRGRARSLTAFHGLASNHLYTSAALGSQCFVGSLAGLVELEGLRVVRTYKTSNSPLSHDWVTALSAVDGALFVGTNGGGVDLLLPTGEWVNFSSELGRFEVNQNAMEFDGERLYVGTSDRGMLVYNTRDRRWTRIEAGLTSPNVTAITTDKRFVYVGTLNGLVRIEKRVIG